MTLDFLIMPKLFKGAAAPSREKSRVTTFVRRVLTLNPNIPQTTKPVRYKLP